MWKGVDKNSLIPKSEGLHVGWARQHEAHVRRAAQGRPHFFGRPTAHPERQIQFALRLEF